MGPDRAGVDRTLGVGMMIPFPADDEPRRAVADFLQLAVRHGAEQSILKQAGLR
jgi:hypothetical protein